MSETTPHEAAITVLRERERELDGEIQGHQRALELATARREELLDLIAVLSRKPRARKVRAIAEPVSAGGIAMGCGGYANDPPPSVFGAPSGAIVEAA